MVRVHVKVGKPWFREQQASSVRPFIAQVLSQPDANVTHPIHGHHHLLALPDNCHPPLFRFLSVSFAFVDSVFPYSLSIFLQCDKESFLDSGLENLKVIKHTVSLLTSTAGFRLD